MAIFTSDRSPEAVTSTRDTEQQVGIGWFTGVDAASADVGFG